MGAAMVLICVFWISPFLLASFLLGTPQIEENLRAWHALATIVISTPVFFVWWGIALDEESVVFGLLAAIANTAAITGWIIFLWLALPTWLAFLPCFALALAGYLIYPLVGAAILDRRGYL